MNAKLIEKLPGDLKALAALIGLDNTMKIVDHWGGSYLSVPKCADLKREVNIIEACQLYDGGGYTIRSLALRFGVSVRTMMKWLKKGSKETSQHREGE